MAGMTVAAMRKTSPSLVATSKTVRPNPKNKAAATTLTAVIKYKTSHVDCRAAWACPRPK
eukprot:scaffold991_cov278-Amphora_coffeaeformis.AAC.6